MAPQKLTLVSVEALSYSGTTWLNLVLGSHDKAFTLGPPDRVWNLRDKGFAGANLVHGAADTFWSGFNEFWDRNENFLLALARYADVTHIIFDNPSPAFRANVMTHPDIHIKTMRYLRDGRTIAASYKRKFKSTPFVDTVIPAGWLFHSFMAIDIRATSTDLQVFRYEDCCARPLEFIRSAGDFVGLDYTERSLRYWEWDHHITMGNQGTIALVKVAKGIPLGNFAGSEFYAEQFQKMQKEPLGEMRDERWREELTREDLFAFDCWMGKKNADLGYVRDTFKPAEIAMWRAKHGDKLPLSDLKLSTEATIMNRLRPLKYRMRGLRDKAMVFVRASRSRITAAKTGYLGSGNGDPGKAPPITSAPRSTYKRKSHASAYAELEPSAYTTSIKGAVYFDTADPKRLADLLPYKAANSAQSRDLAISNINLNFYTAYGPDYTLMPVGKIAVDPMLRFRQLLVALQRIPGVVFVTAEDMITRRPQDGEILIQLRHDVDGDLVAALVEARIESELGIPASFYILHTAPYYGAWDHRAQVFQRNEACAAIYLNMQQLGHEIALHTDALHLYQQLNVDGGEAIRQEIAWLRGQGVRISGTVSHNSVGTYGACNYAVFKDRPVSLIGPPGPKAVTKDGRWAPLQILDEKELGLRYEGNDLFWQKDMRLDYACLMSQNSWYFQTFEGGRIKPKSATHDPKDWMTQDDVVDFVAMMPRPGAMMLSVHCMHYGFRDGMREEPAVAGREIAPDWVPAPLGWITRAPNAPVAAFGGDQDIPEFQSFSQTNALGMLDIPHDKLAPAKHRILFLGRDNIDAPAVSVASKITQHTARLGKQRAKLDLAATSLAGPSINGAIAAGWYGKLRSRDPEPWHTIVFSVGFDDIVVNDREAISRLWGLEESAAAVACPDQLDERALKALASLAPKKHQKPALEVYADAAVVSFLRAGQGQGEDARWRTVSQRLLAQLAYLKSSTQRIVLVVEDCGEKAGLWNGSTPLAERQRLAALADTLFRPLAVSSGAAYVNPYHAFNAYAGQARTHWQSVNQWSIHGHALAGDAVIDMLAKPDEMSG